MVIALMSDPQPSSQELTGVGLVPDEGVGASIHHDHSIAGNDGEPRHRRDVKCAAGEHVGLEMHPWVGNGGAYTHRIGIRIHSGRNGALGRLHGQLGDPEVLVSMRGEHLNAVCMQVHITGQIGQLESMHFLGLICLPEQQYTAAAASHDAH